MALSMIVYYSARSEGPVANALTGQFLMRTTKSHELKPCWHRLCLGNSYDGRAAN